MPSSHLILCRPLLLLPSIFPSIRVFSTESALRIRWPKYWTFSFNISPSNKHPGLISFRMDWLDLLAVQGTLKSLLQHHSSKASILWCSAFFRVQLSHPYITTGKTIALTRRTFVGKVMSLLFHMLSRLVITFLPRSKCLLISWLQSPSVVILEPPKIKSASVSTVSPTICHEVMEPDAMILVFWMWALSQLFHSPLSLSSRGSLNLYRDWPFLWILWACDSSRELDTWVIHNKYLLSNLQWTSLVAQMVKNLPGMRETWVQSLGQEDTLEKRMATHSSILTWRISWTEEPGRLQSVGSQRVRHDWATNNLTFTETKGLECRPKKWEKHKELMTKFKGNIAEKYLDYLQFHLSYLLKNILPPFLLYFSQLLAWGLSAMY